MSIRQTIFDTVVNRLERSRDNPRSDTNPIQLKTVLANFTTPVDLKACTGDLNVRTPVVSVGCGSTRVIEGGLIQTERTVFELLIHCFQQAEDEPSGETMFEKCDKMQQLLEQIAYELKYFQMSSGRSVVQDVVLSPGGINQDEDDRGAATVTRGRRSHGGLFTPDEFLRFDLNFTIETQLPSPF